MKYDSRRLGEELRRELEKGYDVVRISRWAYDIFTNHRRYLDKATSDLLRTLFSMEDDPQFELTEEQLKQLIKSLTFRNATENDIDADHSVEEKLYLLLSQFIDYLPQNVYGNIHNYISHGECGAAFETLCAELYKRSINVTNDCYEDIIKIGFELNVSPDFWQILKN